MSPVYRIYPKQKKSFLSNLSVNTNLILLNIVTYITFYVLIALGVLTFDHIAIKPANIIEGKYIWTFLTSMFMHGNFLHLFVNMFSLFFVGGLVQKILGSKRYLWFYLIAGVFASVFFVLISFILKNSDFNVFAVGASGALFGLIGLLVLLTPNLSVYLMFIPIPIKMKYAGPGILIVLWIISYLGNVPIGNTAHFGGLIAGLVYGIYLRINYKNKVRMIGKHFS